MANHTTFPSTPLPHRPPPAFPSTAASSANHNLYNFSAVALTVLCATVFYSCFVYPRYRAYHRRRWLRQQHLMALEMQRVNAGGVGFKEEEIGGVGALETYAETSSKEKDKEMLHECVVCLAEYKGSDKIRKLNACGHFFHQECVDEWLRKHTSCPLCRKQLREGEAESQGGEVPSAPSSAPPGSHVIVMRHDDVPPVLSMQQVIRPSLS